MDDKELKIDSLKYISTVHRNILKERISQEWKILVLVLTYYVGIGSSKKLGIELSECVLFSAVIIPALVSCSFLYFLHQANLRNKNFAHTAENSLMDYVENGDFTFVNPGVSKSLIIEGRSRIAFAWQLIIIFSFAAASFFAATS